MFAVGHGFLQLGGAGFAYELWALWQQVCLAGLVLQTVIRCSKGEEYLQKSVATTILLYTVPLASEIFDTMKDWMLTGCCLLAKPTLAGGLLGVALVLVEIWLVKFVFVRFRPVSISRDVRMCPPLILTQLLFPAFLTFLLAVLLVLAVSVPILGIVVAVAVYFFLMVFLLLSFVANAFGMECHVFTYPGQPPADCIFQGFLDVMRNVGLWLISVRVDVPYWFGKALELCKAWYLTLTDGACLFVLSAYVILYAYVLVNTFHECKQDLKKTYWGILELPAVTNSSTSGPSVSRSLRGKILDMAGSFAADLLSSSRLMICWAEDWPQGFVGVMLVARYSNGLGVAGLSAIASFAKGLLIPVLQTYLFQNRKTRFERICDHMRSEDQMRGTVNNNSLLTRTKDETSIFLTEFCHEHSDIALSGLSVQRGRDLWVPIFEYQEQWIVDSVDAFMRLVFNMHVETKTLPSALAELGYTANDFHSGGLTAAECKTARFTAKECKLAGYSARHCYDAGFSTADCLNAGFSTSDCKEAGCSVKECVEAGAPIARCKKAGYTMAEFKEAALVGSAADAKRLGFDLCDCKQAGFPLADARKAGYDFTLCHAAGYSIKECNLAGFHPKLPELKTCGYSYKDCREAGFSKAACTTAGYVDKDIPVPELKASGYSLADCIKAGHLPEACREGGYTHKDFMTANLPYKYFIHGLSLASLPTRRQAGFSIEECGVSSNTVREFHIAGFSFAECWSAGYSILECRQGGFSVKDCVEAGLSLAECKEAGYTAERFKSSGFAIEDCKEAGFSAIECKQADFSASECHRVGLIHTAVDFKNLHYTVQDCAQAGFSLADCLQAGYSVTECLSHSFHTCWFSRRNEQTHVNDSA